MSSEETVRGWVGRRVSEGWEKLCHTGRLPEAAEWRMKLPDSAMDADWTPAPEVLDVQRVTCPSVRTRLPVASSSKIAF